MKTRIQKPLKVPTFFRKLSRAGLVLTASLLVAGCCEEGNMQSTCGKRTEAQKKELCTVDTAQACLKERDPLTGSRQRELILENIEAELGWIDAIYEMAQQHGKEVPYATTASSYAEIALNYYSCGYLAEAKKYSQKALELLEMDPRNVDSLDSVVYSRTYLELARLVIYLGDFELAKQYALEATYYAEKSGQQNMVNTTKKFMEDTIPCCEEFSEGMLK